MKTHLWKGQHNIWYSLGTYFMTMKTFAFLNHLTHWLLELFAKNAFRALWRFSAWIWAKLAPFFSKRHLKNDSMPLILPTSITFYGIWQYWHCFFPFLLFLYFCGSDWPSIACVASVSVGFGSKERPRNGVFGILPAQKMRREPKKEQWG